MKPQGKMDKSRKNIIVLEPSEILFEGLLASISKLENDYTFYHIDSLSEIEPILLRKEISVVMINPVMVQNKLNEFTRIKNQYPKIHWTGIIYSFFDNSILKLFDDTFSITDDVSSIVQKIKNVSNTYTLTGNQNGQLSERETDVLRLLAKGLSNKEIADKLNISVHTVNTHRKNIMDKTDIRSLAGLTVYAVTKEIISLD